MNPRDQTAGPTPCSVHDYLETLVDKTLESEIKRGTELQALKQRPKLRKEKSKSPTKNIKKLRHNLPKNKNTRKNVSCEAPKHRQCSLRIAELSVPTKRHCIETWRNNYHILPEIMIERLRNHVLGLTPVVKIPDAIECFQRCRNSKIRNKKKSKAKRKKENKRDGVKITFEKESREKNCNLKRYHKNLCIIFGHKIAKTLYKPTSINLNTELKKIFDVVSMEIEYMLKKGQYNGHKFVKNDKLQDEVAETITVWIAGILEDTDNNILESQLLELEEEIGPVLDIIDDLIDSVVASCEPDISVVEIPSSSLIDSKDSLDIVEADYELEPKISHSSFTIQEAQVTKDLDSIIGSFDKDNFDRNDETNPESIRDTSIVDYEPEIVENSTEHRSKIDNIEGEDNEQFVEADENIDQQGANIENIKQNELGEVYGNIEYDGLTNLENTGEQEIKRIEDDDIQQEKFEDADGNIEYDVTSTNVGSTGEQRAEYNSNDIEQFKNTSNNITDDGLNSVGSTGEQQAKANDVENGPGTVGSGADQQVNENDEAALKSTADQEVNETINLESNDVIVHVSDDDLFKKVKFSEKGLVKNYGSSEYNIATSQTSLIKERKFSEVNEFLLSDADEIWPVDIPILRPSESVSKSITSLGLLVEADEKTSIILFDDTNVKQTTITTKTDIPTINIFNQSVEATDIISKTDDIDKIEQQGKEDIQVDEEVNDVQQKNKDDLGGTIQKTDADLRGSLDNFIKNLLETTLSLKANVLGSDKNESVLNSIDKKLQSGYDTENIMQDQEIRYMSKRWSEDSIYVDKVSVAPITFTSSLEHISENDIVQASIILQNLLDEQNAKHEIVTSNYYDPHAVKPENTKAETSDKITNTSLSLVLREDKATLVTSQSLSDIVKHQTKEKPAFSSLRIKPKTDYKVNKKSAPAWVTQTFSEPSPKKEPTEKHIRLWCKDLQAGFDNLEIWNKWLENTTGIVEVMEQAKATKNLEKWRAEYQREWMCLKKDIDADVVTWIKHCQSTQDKIKCFRKVYKYFQTPLTHKPCSCNK